MHVLNHNVIEDDYYTNLKSKLREREQENLEFPLMKYDDYKSADTGPYGIFSNNIPCEEADDSDDEDDITARYERLMLERSVDIAPAKVPKTYHSSKQNKSRKIPRKF